MTYKKSSSCSTTNTKNINANAIKYLNRETDFGENLELSVSEIRECLADSCAKIKDDNDLSELTDMLVCQTHTLQNLFLQMISMATRADGIDHIALLASVALKTQSQCRSTILAIAEIKNPKRATFIKQQTNQSLGHMQINNKEQTQQSKQADFPKNSDEQANKLLEQTHGERLDFGTTQEAIGINKELEAVGKINRAKKRDRQNNC